MKLQINARNRGYPFQCEDGENVLLAGLRQGVDLPYECGSGTCGTCKAKLVSGQLEDRWPAAVGKKYLREGDGQFLMCQCVPVTDCVVEVANFVYASDPGACLPRASAGVISTWKMLTRDVAFFEIELEDPIEFDAGQYVLVGFPGLQGRRAYSMVNFARGARKLAFVIKKKPGGGFSEVLFGATPVGTAVEVIGPLGHATFYPGLGKNILCIAGGSGIAGMMSILSRAVEERYFGQYKGYVFFGVRTMEDAFFLEELSKFREAFPTNLEVVVALSDEDVPESAGERYPSLKFDRGFVHDVAAKRMNGKYQNVRVYLAGPPPAVDAAIRTLIIGAKVSADSIVYDKFS